MQPATLPPSTADAPVTATPVNTRIPWYLWVSAAAITSAMIGAHWDISWHRSIGRDTFLTPPHIAIYLCGVLAGLACGYLILATTFGNRSGLRDHSVSVLGFRAPLGAFITAWGGIAMLTSAPFDNWWHEAYGLDVKILSPPHVVLALGIFAVGFGALLLTLSHLNRSQDKVALGLFLYISAMLVVARAVMTLEFTGRVWMHTVVYYRAAVIIFPLALVMAHRVTGHRWAATIVTGGYTAMLLAFQWVLPLFPAQPKLGPVFHDLTYFVPNGFPMLAIVPAFALDLLWQRTPHWGEWRRAIVSGIVFVALLLAVQWPFGYFLNSTAAYNWFFGSHHFDFYTRPTSYNKLNRMVVNERTPLEFATGMAGVTFLAILISRVGFAMGSWMTRVVR